MQQSVPAPTPILLWRSFESSPFSPLRSDSSAMPFNSAGGNRGVRRLCLWHCFVRQQGILCRSLGSESLEWYKEGEMHAQNSKFHFSFAQRLNSQNLSPTQPIQFRWVSQQILQQLPGWVCWVVFQSSWNEYTESANIQRTLNLSLVVRHRETLWDIERVCFDCTAGSRCTGHGALWKWTEPTEPIQCIWRLIMFDLILLEKWWCSAGKLVCWCMADLDWQTALKWRACPTQHGSSIFVMFHTPLKYLLGTDADVWNSCRSTPRFACCFPSSLLTVSWKESSECFQQT